MSAPLDKDGNVAISHFAEIQRRDRDELGFKGEVKRLAHFDTNAKRTLYLEDVWTHRGRDEAERLRKAVWQYMVDNEIQPETAQPELFPCN